MKILGKFEIIALKTGKVALVGNLLSGGPLLTEKDVINKNICISFFFYNKEIKKKIIVLDGGFGRLSKDFVIGNFDNIALLIELDNDT